MMTSPNGNIFRVTGHLCGEFTGHRLIPRTNASDAELWWFFCSAPEWTVGSGDLRRYRAHYDVTVMRKWDKAYLPPCSFPVLWNWLYRVWSFSIDYTIVTMNPPNNINRDHNNILIKVSTTTLITIIIMIITIALENSASSATLSPPHCWLIWQ